MSSHDLIDTLLDKPQEPDVSARARRCRWHPGRKPSADAGSPSGRGRPRPGHGGPTARIPDPGTAGDAPADRADVAWLMGMAAGCARGLVAGRRRALAEVLDARFGPLDADSDARLAAVEPTLLDQRLRDAVRAPDIGAFWRRS